MGQLVVMGAMMACSFGMAPSSLIVVPKGTPIMAGGLPAANIGDSLPIVNIPTFGMCITPTNPAVAAATAAALGVLTPMPCIPVTTAPWVPGSVTTMINEMPALTNTSTCLCTWGGMITITFPGQVEVTAT